MMDRLRSVLSSFKRRRFWVPAAIILGALVSPLQVGVVLGSSMSPSFRSGTVYLMDRVFFRFHPVRRGDVVVFDRDGVTYIKRVLASGGEHVLLLRSKDADEYELVPDWQLSRLLRLTKTPPWAAEMQLVDRRVPEGYCFVVGDNLDDSVDSRIFGLVPQDSIRGRVLDAPAPVPELSHLAVSLAGAQPL